MVLCRSLLETCVQSLKLIFKAVFVLELVMCSPPRNVSLGKFLKSWKLQYQIPFKHIFWSNYHLSNFFWKSLTSNKSIFERKSKYLNSIRASPFFISFSCWNETNTNSSIKEDRRKMENCNIKPITLQKNFLEVTGNRVSYYYARNMYIKVFL